MIAALPLGWSWPCSKIKIHKMVGSKQSENHREVSSSTLTSQIELEVID